MSSDNLSNPLCASKGVLEVVLEWWGCKKH